MSARRFLVSGLVALQWPGICMLPACRGEQTDAGPGASYESAPAAEFSEGMLLETPVHMPTSDDGRLRIAVYLILPAEGTITGASLATLRYPQGTRAERVEYLAPAETPRGAAPADTWLKADVRGLVMRRDQVEHHVFRPGSADPKAPLRGQRWNSDDLAAHDRGTEGLRMLARSGTILAPKGAQEREALAERLGKLNDCVGCHARGKPEAESVSPSIVVRRASDADGFFQVMSVFRNEAPIEVYRPRDRNREDPFVRVVCAGNAAVMPSAHGAALCADGKVPRARYDLTAARASGDPRTERICRARRYLFDHMAPESQLAVREALDECGAGVR